ncbi:MAG: D-aminoacylase [Burkholderia gladioli]|nr:MAG: D-aminoacylase [Burkholderia gladioli]
MPRPSTRQPAVNVAALVGHTVLRNNQMDRLDRAASSEEIAAMRLQLEEALLNGALGLSSGLASGSAFAAPVEEGMALAGALYPTHMRTEFDAILDAMEEAYRVGRHARVPVVISHLKCAGPSNWGGQRRGARLARPGAPHPAGRLRLLPRTAAARRRSI